MSPNEVRVQPTERIVEMLVGLEPSDEAVAWLASVISSPTTVAGVSELARRYNSGKPVSRSSDATTYRNATSIKLDPQAFRQFFFRRRMTLSEIGPLFNRCSGWANAICHRGTIGLYAADELASELGLHLDEFLRQICAPEELERLYA